MIQADARTLSSLVRDATTHLTAAGVASARWEAERLAAHALGVDWGDIWVRLREEVGEETAQRLSGFVERRAGGEPLAYILCSTIFYGSEIAVGPGVLVPRPETETLVEASLELARDVPDPRIVDVGCGSGAIAIALALERSGAEVWGTDISQRALEWAELNVGSAGADVRLVRGDLFEAIPASLRGSFDLIVSNPPYIADGAQLPPDVRAEPEQALFAGPGGADVLLRLVDESVEWLKGSGALALEVGTADQAQLVAEALASWSRVSIREDRAGRLRVVTARR
jgi:release factor glutamine methyltransferase